MDNCVRTLMSVVVAFILVGTFSGCFAGENAPAVSQAYQPSTENLSNREWFRDARFGIFIHWGVYSVLGEGEWVMHQKKMTNEEYEKLPAQFNPTKYNPAEWVALFKKAGARYVTITSKHHDGFAMWNSQVSDWDIVDRTPYKRDVLKPLTDECKKEGLKLFFYHSHLDWHHPDYFPRGSTGQYSRRPDSGNFHAYLDYMDAQLSELLSGRYGEVGGMWFDGWWDQHKKEEGKQSRETYVDWRLGRTYGLIHRLQPGTLIGNNHHVSVFAGEDFQMFERDLPGENKSGHDLGAEISGLPLETCATMNNSWGYNSKDTNFKTSEELIHLLVRAVGSDANLLLNVGPRPDGTIQQECVERLEAIGAWLESFGETIYGTRAGPLSNQLWGTSTQKDGKVYLHVLNSTELSKDRWLTLTGSREFKMQKCMLFGEDVEVAHRRTPEGILQIRMPKQQEEAIDTVLVVR